MSYTPIPEDQRKRALSIVTPADRRFQSKVKSIGVALTPKLVNIIFWSYDLKADKQGLVSQILELTEQLWPLVQARPLGGYIKFLLPSKPEVKRLYSEDSNATRAWIDHRNAEYVSLIRSFYVDMRTIALDGITQEKLCYILEVLRPQPKPDPAQKEELKVLWLKVLERSLHDLVHLHATDFDKRKALANRGNGIRASVLANSDVLFRASINEIQGWFTSKSLDEGSYLWICETCAHHSSILFRNADFKLLLSKDHEAAHKRAIELKMDLGKIASTFGQRQKQVTLKQVLIQPVAESKPFNVRFSEVRYIDPKTVNYTMDSKCHNI